MSANLSPGRTSCIKVSQISMFESYQKTFQRSFSSLLSGNHAWFTGRFSHCSYKNTNISCANLLYLDIFRIMLGTLWLFKTDCVHGCKLASVTQKLFSFQRQKKTFPCTALIDLFGVRKLCIFNFCKHRSHRPLSTTATGPLGSSTSSTWQWAPGAVLSAEC